MEIVADRRSDCPIASSLELVGDRWTLVIVRDLLSGKTRFQELLDSPEGISTNILTDRLKRMEAAGLVERQRYEERPPRYGYHLTAQGEALLPVLQEVCRWGNRYLPGTWTPPAWFMERRIEN